MKTLQSLISGRGADNVFLIVLQGRFDAVTVFSKVSEAQIRHEVVLLFGRRDLVP